MSRGRPRKSSAQRAVEGNPGKRPIPPDMPLEGFPVLPDSLEGDHAREHFRFVCGEFGGVGFLKRADGPGVEMLAMAWELVKASYQAQDVSAFAKSAAAWHKAASALGIQVVDRAKLMALVGAKAEESPLRAKFRIAE